MLKVKVGAWELKWLWLVDLKSHLIGKIYLRHDFRSQYPETHIWASIVHWTPQLCWYFLYVVLTVVFNAAKSLRQFCTWRLTMGALCRVEIFRVNPRFYILSIVWNLEWSKEIPNPILMVPRLIIIVLSVVQYYWWHGLEFYPRLQSVLKSAIKRPMWFFPVMTCSSTILYFNILEDSVGTFGLFPIHPNKMFMNFIIKWKNNLDLVHVPSKELKTKS